MVSIGKIAVGQHAYYEQQVAQGADDYYTGRGEVPGEWQGAGAQALGLSGRVEGGQFNALVAGMDPRDPSVRLRWSVRDPEVAALDLTFSAPKSVSVLAAAGPNDLTRVLVGAHNEAVTAALAYLDDSAVFVRRGHDGTTAEAGEGLIAAAYLHRMSRSLDPQLHTHVVAANLTRGPDGRFTALHGAPLYRAAKTAGYLYQSHLRVTISERLGLEWGEVRKGAAELAGVPAEILVEFSKRRQEMLRAAELGGISLDTKAGGEAAALATRERKEYGIDTHTWREEVQARASELGLGREEINELLDIGRKRLAHGLPEHDVSDELALGDRLAGPHGLTERANSFDERVVLQEFAAAAGQGATVDEIREQADRFTRRPDVLATELGEFTTLDLVDCERRLITAAVGRAEDVVGVLDSRTVARVIKAAGRPLPDDQAAVVRAVASSGRGVEVVEALAGTGKTYTAGVLRGLYENAGYDVLGVAPTGRAARELTDQAGIPSRTLDRLLIDLDELGDSLPKRCVVVLDEAGMAATRSTALLLEAAERAGAKVIAIGDPGQLASVQAGGWLRAVGRHLGALRLTEVMRQRDPGERRALAALHDRIPDRYLDWATRAGRVDTFKDAAGARDAAVVEWADAVREVGVDQAVMIARDNDTRRTLNTAARELRRDQGQLGDQRVYGRRELAVGDRVICRRNDGLLDVDNGTRGTVRHLDEHRVVIETDSRLVRELPANYVAEHVEHAYALTGHGMQGATVEAAIVVATPRDLTAGWSYTALSRARASSRLLIHDDQPARERADHAPEPEHEPATRDELLARAGRRMLDRDDQDLAIEQLPPAGRAGDRRLALALDLADEPAQEHAALRAEPDTPPAGTSRLRELGERVEQLSAQRAALPISQLGPLDAAHARVLELTERRDELSASLERLPAPKRSVLGRERDEYVIDRARLATALNGTDDAIVLARDAEVRLRDLLGDREQIRSELDGLDREIRELTSERDPLLNDLTERELQAPGEWAKSLLGERPAGSRSEDWESAVRRVARYRIEHDITDQTDALGPEPRDHHQAGQWHRAHETVERAERRLGREHTHEHDHDLDIGM
ncbi:MAG TPA: MobF family relaxase [Solirubrobacteraceae bacterium]|nr:MobF family relaxase [Solirubrobacteraceae bacterium]